MKYIVAIDWKSRYRKGFSFINLESKGKIEAMIEAPAAACKYGASLEYNALENKDGKSPMDMEGMRGIFCLRLLKQNKSEEKARIAKDCGVTYIPPYHKWREDEEDVNQIWYL